MVTTAHDEEFGDHGGIQHGRALFDELIRVPLLISGSGIPRGKVVESRRRHARATQGLGLSSVAASRTLPALTPIYLLHTIGLMKTYCRLVTSLTVAVLFVFVAEARAQRPVCEPLATAEKVHEVCSPFSHLPALRFLADFTVDHLFKPSPPSFSRGILDLGNLVAARSISEDPALAGFLGDLSPIRFSQLDRATGTLLAEFEANSLDFAGPATGLSGDPTLTVDLPPLLRGGYWRGPDVLQMVFWEGNRVNFAFTTAGHPVLKAAIACLSLSPDGLLVRFVNEQTPPLLVRFRDCLP